MHILRSPGKAYQVPAPSASSGTAQAITAGVYAITLFARNSDIRYALAAGATGAVADATSGDANSHYLGLGERVDLIIPQGQGAFNIAAYGVSGVGVLEVSELY